MYVVEQGGRIIRIAGGKRTPERQDVSKPGAAMEGRKRTVFADLTDSIDSGANEMGLLSLAFAPDFREERPTKIYVNYTASGPRRTEVTEFRVRPGPRFVPASRRVLLKIPQPYSNHNGGHILFGPDKMLYIATGDGGSGGDPRGYGQKQNTLLGKILRIDPRPPSSAAGARAYSIPRDNPFRGIGRYRPEIFATGLRNPWRVSFDRRTGKLYAGDVGQNKQEEIDLVRPGDNLGWNVMEGELCFKPRKNCRRSGLVMPLHVYGRDQGVSVTGGYVYRGRRLSGLQGQYFFADYGSRNVWSFPVGSNGRRAGRVVLQFKNAGNISSFGEDRHGELYLVRHSRGDVVKIGR